MTDVVIMDIDGVLSDCTERFRTLYEGQYLPMQDPWFTFYEGIEAAPITLNGAMFKSCVDTSLKQTFYYNETTGHLYLGDGSTIVRDLPVLATMLERNPDWTPDWERFHDGRMDKEPPHPEFVRLARLLHRPSEGQEVHLVTARSEIYRARTASWLRRHVVSYTGLHMRHEDHGWENSKLHAIRELQRREMNIMLAIDDDPANRNLYENNDIPFLYVHRGHHDGEVKAH